MVESVGGEALRFFCVSHHYRSPVDFDVQVVDGVARFFSLEAADRSLSGFYTTLQRIDQFIGDNDGGAGAGRSGECGGGAALSGTGVPAHSMRVGRPFLPGM